MLQNLCKSRALPLFLVLGLVFLTPGLRAQNPAPACDLAGTWYGGGDTAKYLMTVTPAQGGEA